MMFSHSRFILALFELRNFILALRGHCPPPQPSATCLPLSVPLVSATATPTRTINIHPAHVCPACAQKRPIS